jgi:RNA polymerase sigma-70 factor, ECF subfamily
MNSSSPDDQPLSPDDQPLVDPARTAQLDLVERIRQGRSDAWQQFIDRYEGRLLAYVDSRIRNRATAEDIVQEALVGFLVSLPNYDGKRPLEAYLFSICAYKLTDHLRRSGRRPAMQMMSGQRSRDENWDPQGRGPVASSIARSSERKKLEATAISQSISEQIRRWKAEENWPKLKAIEMIYVQGIGNKEIANETGLSEQQVANLKSDFQIRLRSMIGRMGLDPSVFPELSPPS